MPVGNRLVSLITSDTKADWWDLDSHRRLRGARTELIQELRDSATADLLLLTLKDFLDGAAQHLSSNVSSQTLHEVQEAAFGAAQPMLGALSDPSAELDLLSITPGEFEHVVRSLFIRMGYEILETPRDGTDVGYDLIMTGHGITDRGSILVNAKRYRMPVSVTHVRELIGTMAFTGAQSGVLVTTASFTSSAMELAQQASTVTLIDGVTLLQYLARYGYRARINADTDEA